MKQTKSISQQQSHITRHKLKVIGQINSLINKLIKERDAIERTLSPRQKYKRAVGSKVR